MTQEQQQAILTIALLAAFADGAKDEPEREEIRRIADTLSDIAEAIDLKRLYQDVLLKRVGLEQATAALTETGQRQYAYEMAVCVCEADGRRSDAERRFLGDLKAALGLDQGHTKEFIAAAGVGLTSQYLEQFGRKLLGGLLGKMAGKTAGKAGRAATGMTFSFATTYALGQVAKRYYAGGRTMNTNMLQETFRDLLGSAKQMQQQYLPQIEQKAATLDASQVMALMRT